MEKNVKKTKKEIERFREYYDRLKACRVFGKRRNWYKQELIQATKGMLISLQNVKDRSLMDDPVDVMKMAEVFGKTLENYLAKNE